MTDLQRRIEAQRRIDIETQRRIEYEAHKRVPVEDRELRVWLDDLKRRRRQGTDGAFARTLATWEPHVELRMQRIFARLRELELSDIVDVIEMYVEYRASAGAKP